MNSFRNIAFIGAGNLAWHLAPALENLGHRVSMIYNRTPKHGRQLLERLYNSRIKKDLDFGEEALDMIVLTVQDSIIADIVAEIIVPDNCILIHTSGTQSMEILERSAAPHIGVFYPLQTFTKGTKIDYRSMPVCIESNSDYGIKSLISIAKDLSKNVYQIDSVQRRALHLSAVMASNFSNHMLTIAGDLLREQGMDQSLLYPVVHSMIEKAFTIGPEAGQTGPARRGDHETMDTHMEMLRKNEDLMEIYSILSNHIIKYYGNS